MIRILCRRHIRHGDAGTVGRRHIRRRGLYEQRRRRRPCTPSAQAMRRRPCTTSARLLRADTATAALLDIRSLGQGRRQGVVDGAAVRFVPCDSPLTRRDGDDRRWHSGPTPHPTSGLLSTLSQWADATSAGTVGRRSLGQGHRQVVVAEAIARFVPCDTILPRRDGGDVACTESCAYVMPMHRRNNSGESCPDGLQSPVPSPDDAST